MELHPILEARSPPNEGLWYCISAQGDQPKGRSGHSCTYIPGPDRIDGKIYVIGGATPEGVISDVNILDLSTYAWEQVEFPGFKARYEHAAFVPKSKPNCIYIFGGAMMSGNLNDMQVLDISAKTCQTVSVVSGNAPSPRTCHTTASFGDKFYVYSGGHEQNKPVPDRQVHCFDASAHSWTTLNVKGDPPKPRQGHAMVAADENKLVVYGGMSGNTFYNDVHILDIKLESWKKLKVKKNAASPRAALATCCNDGNLYVFGGLHEMQILDDYHQLHLESNSWRSMELFGSPPPSRISADMCVIHLLVPDIPAEENGAGGCTAAGGDAGGGERGENSTDQLLAASQKTKETLEEQLRLGSAGSVRSMASSSAGSVRSDPNIIPLELQEAPVVSPPPRPVAQEISGPSKVVDLCFMMGGMDADANFFNDCFVYLLKENKLEQAEGATGTS